MRKLLLFTSILFYFAAVAQPLKTPAQLKNFESPSSYEEMVNFIGELDSSSGLVSVEPIGKSVLGRDLFALKFSKMGTSNSKMGTSNKKMSTGNSKLGTSIKQPKIKVLIMAQQHGNEQSGKEGALLLAAELIKPEYSYLFERIDLFLVPQVNPDGSGENERRNSNGVDLNRNHVLMSEPEVVALHRLFDKYLFEVTMDVHEYYPYRESWISRGYSKNSHLLIGWNTNPQIPTAIRDFQKRKYMLFWSEYLNKSGVSNGVYTPGGPTDESYVRYSTFDVNDGRQSFGIQNSFSFIQEGLNGEDSFIYNLSNRAYSQSCGMLALLEFVYKNQIEMQKIVARERKNLISAPVNEDVAIQMEHVADGSSLKMRVYSYFSKRDSTIEFKNFRPVVKPVLSVKKPFGYLIPSSQKELVNWAKRVGFEFATLSNSKNLIFEKLAISAIDSIDFEGDIIASPKITAAVISEGLSLEHFVFIPTAQLKGTLLVLALEPQSQLGLITYSLFEHLMKAQTTYPVIRVKEQN